MSFSPDGYALPADGGKSTWFLDTRMTVKAGGEQTSGAYTFLEWAAPAGFGPPLHRHDREDEAFYLIDGAIEVSCGDKQWTVGPGGFVFLPRGIPHSFVVSAGPVRGLQITTPSGFERFSGELGIPAAGPGLPPPAVPDIPRMIEASGRHGMEILGPPPHG
jgi:quercetin dioxygenase-like cupin family protein